MWASNLSTELSGIGNDPTMWRQFVREKVHWLLPRNSVAEERGVLAAEVASNDWALVFGGAHTQSIC